GVSLDIWPQQLTAFIGPSGCGKSTLLGCFNRINDLSTAARIQGRITYRGQPLQKIPEIALRRQIGMVFQRPTPFPKSIFNNIALGLRINGYQGDIDERVEQSLQKVGLWSEVKDRLTQSALTLSGGQQQRLCIARAIALGSAVLLMDEPCASLDPISAGVISDLLNDLKQQYTIVIVTHNLKQAAAVADWVGYFQLSAHGSHQVGRLVEYGPVPEIFVRPKQAATREYMYYYQSLPQL
ncbi:MAG: phosphate ABC transporter ATP-binding protein, partial [Cyanobacteria bacterium]|nr:phosphate ABC transporter ATP-binding protein [Cyanobacteriota bacterium]